MKSVVKGTGYILVHTPQMVVHNGATQVTERMVNADSEYLQKLPEHLRSYQDACAYWPNQVYIGNKTPNDLAEVEFPWYDKKCDIAERYGAYGEIMPEDEFTLLLGICDVFDLVALTSGFIEKVTPKLSEHPLMSEDILKRIPKASELSEIERLVKEEAAEGLYEAGTLVGCVKRAHAIDHNFSAEIMHENLVEKASSVLALLHGVKNAGLERSDIDYVIDCSEEACGDMNQRGGGNFAKAAAEIAGLINATGSDTRGFCAAPTHALIEAAALVASGTYKAVAVTAGGCTAKLGMNGKEHVKKGLPILEDMIGGMCIVVTPNDGKNPVIDLEHIGRVHVGCGSAPQAVMQSLVYDPLEAAGLKATDVDKYAPELQNPDITKPAGAGDVPLGSYKMIAALGVKRGELERSDIDGFVKKHGLTGFAPTQGHIPSGTPCVGYARDALMKGEINRLMIIGKGSLFLGRMTNLFDGVSVMLTKPEAESEKKEADDQQVRSLIADAFQSFAEKLMAEE